MTTIKVNEITQFAGHAFHSPGAVVDDPDTNRAAYLIGMGSVAAHDGIPVNLVAPRIVMGGAIVTAAEVDDVLTCSPGEWEGLADGGAGDDEIALTYQWKADDVDIGGATNSTFTVTVTQAGTDITCVVTGTNDEGNDTGTTQAVAIPA